MASSLPELSPFTIEVEGEEITVPTFGIDEEAAKDLLTMPDPSTAEIDGGGFIQRSGYRWFVYNGEQWYSLRLLN